MADAILFAGPTLARARAMATVSTDGLRLAPPVRRGDVARAAARGPGTMVIVDGIFHGGLSVGHRELREAIEAGWRVFGLSSMGAIRARELRHLGMRGYGRVYDLYCRDGVDFRDDEVALLHEPGPPWRELSEPLVHLRAALDDLVARDVLRREVAHTIAQDLADLWFGERTLSRFGDLLIGAGVIADEVTNTIVGFDTHRLKALDLVAFLAERPDRLPLQIVPVVEASKFG